MKKARVFLGRIWGMLRHPVRTYRTVGEEGLRGTLWYFLVVLLVLAVILLIGGAVVYPRFLAPYLGEYSSLGWISLVLVVPFVLVFGFIALMLGGLILHLFVWLLGGKQGLSQTYKAYACGNTPLLLSLWFPPILVVTGIWSLVLAIVGIRDMQKLSTARAIGSVLIPLALVAAVSFAVTALS